MSCHKISNVCHSYHCKYYLRASHKNTIRNVVANIKAGRGFVSPSDFEGIFKIGANSIGIRNKFSCMIIHLTLNNLLLLMSMRSYQGLMDIFFSVSVFIKQTKTILVFIWSVFLQGLTSVILTFVS